MCCYTLKPLCIENLNYLYDSMYALFGIQYATTKLFTKNSDWIDILDVGHMVLIFDYHHFL